MKREEKLIDQLEFLAELKNDAEKRGLEEIKIYTEIDNHSEYASYFYLSTKKIGIYRLGKKQLDPLKSICETILEFMFKLDCNFEKYSYNYNKRISLFCDNEIVTEIKELEHVTIQSLKHDYYVFNKLKHTIQLVKAPKKTRFPTLDIIMIQLKSDIKELILYSK